MDSLPVLNGSDHTIFGRLVSGTEVVKMVEGVDEFRKLKAEVERKPMSEIEKSKVVIRNSGVYKFE